MSRAQVPPTIREAVCLGRLTALQKPSGGVRGIVARERRQEVGRSHDVAAVDGGSQAAIAPVSACDVYQEWVRMHRTRFARAY